MWGALNLIPFIRDQSDSRDASEPRLLVCSSLDMARLECPTCGSELLFHRGLAVCFRCGSHSLDELISDIPRLGLGGIDRVMEQMFPSDSPAEEGETEEARLERIRVIRAEMKEGLIARYGPEADFHARDLLLIVWVGQYEDALMDEDLMLLMENEEEEEEEDEGMTESTVEPDEDDLYEDAFSE